MKFIVWTVVIFDIDTWIQKKMACKMNRLDKKKGEKDDEVDKNDEI